MSDPVSTKMGDRVRVQFGMYNQPSRPTQPSIPPGSVNEDQLAMEKAGMVHSVSG